MNSASSQECSMGTTIWCMAHPAMSLMQDLDRPIWANREDQMSRRLQGEDVQEPALMIVPDVLSVWFDIVVLASGELLLSSAAVECLRNSVKEDQLLPVHFMSQTSRGRKAARQAIAEEVTLQRIWLAYGFREVAPDREKSSFVPGKMHPEYGQLSGKWEGLEFRFKDFARLEGNPGVLGMPGRLPREPGKGVYVAKGMVGEIEIFTVQGTDWLMCTDAVREKILRNGLAGIEFLEYGDVF